MVIWGTTDFAVTLHINKVMIPTEWGKTYSNRHGCLSPDFYSCPQRPCSFWSPTRIMTSGETWFSEHAQRHWIFVIHRLPVKSDKSDWLGIRNEYPAQAQDRLFRGRDLDEQSLFFLSPSNKTRVTEGAPSCLDAFSRTWLTTRHAVFYVCAYASSVCLIGESKL